VMAIRLYSVPGSIWCVSITSMSLVLYLRRGHGAKQDGPHSGSPSALALHLTSHPYHVTGKRAGPYILVSFDRQGTSEGVTASRTVGKRLSSVVHSV
jgi:hypothetical protein